MRCLTAALLLLAQPASAQPAPQAPPDQVPGAAQPAAGDPAPTDPAPTDPVPGDPSGPVPPAQAAADTEPPAQPEQPLVMADPSEPPAPPQRDKGQRGHTLREANYRVDTTEAKIKHTHRHGVRAPNDSRVGLTLSGGGLLTPGLSQGWYGRIDGTVLSGYAGDWHQVFGVLAGVEYWSASNGSGGGIPAALRIGLVGPLSQVAVDLGAETLIFDDRDDDFGIGIYAPFARAVLGFDFGSVALLVDSQVQYRWQWGAPDFTDYRLGASLSLLGEPPAAPKARPR